MLPCLCLLPPSRHPPLLRHVTRRLQVEQRRRERAKECFDEIRRMLPPEFDIKPDKNSILLAVIKHIEDLRLQASSL